MAARAPLRFTHIPGWEQQLDDSAAEVFTAMLDGACDETLCPAETEPLEYEALVRIRGGVEGQCVLQCSPKTACLLAERLVLGPVALGDPLASDALGELCNMVAGAWKNRIARMIAQACMLSAPRVTTSAGQRKELAEEAAGANVADDSKMMCRRCYTFGGRPLEIVLFSGPEAAPMLMTQADTQRAPLASRPA